MEIPYNGHEKPTNTFQNLGLVDSRCFRLSVDITVNLLILLLLIVYLLELVEIAIDHVAIINKQRNNAVLNFTMHAVFLLKYKNHYEVESEHSFTDFF